MGYRVSREYPMSASDFFDRITDPEVIVGRFTQAGDTDVVVERCGADNGGFVVTWRRVSRADIPRFASKIISPKNTLTQTDHWNVASDDGSRTGTLEGTTEGAPASLSGSMTLQATGPDTCRYTIEGTLQMKVPLIGGRIGKWGEGEITKRLEAELDFLETATSH